MTLWAGSTAAAETGRGHFRRTSGYVILRAEKNTMTGRPSTEQP
jgi:hypothetical protein